MKQYQVFYCTCVDSFIEILPSGKDAIFETKEEAFAYVRQQTRGCKPYVEGNYIHNDHYWYEIYLDTPVKEIDGETIAQDAIFTSKKYYK